MVERTEAVGSDGLIVGETGTEVEMAAVETSGRSMMIGEVVAMVAAVGKIDRTSMRSKAVGERGKRM